MSSRTPKGPAARAHHVATLAGLEGRREDYTTKLIRTHSCGLYLISLPLQLRKRSREALLLILGFYLLLVNAPLRWLCRPLCRCLSL
jgi:hypothetical protein